MNVIERDMDQPLHLVMTGRDRSNLRPYNWHERLRMYYMSDLFRTADWRCGAFWVARFRCLSAT